LRDSWRRRKRLSDDKGSAEKSTKVRSIDITDTITAVPGATIPGTTILMTKMIVAQSARGIQGTKTIQKTDMDTDTDGGGRAGMKARMVPRRTHPPKGQVWAS